MGMNPLAVNIAFLFVQEIDQIAEDALFGGQIASNERHQRE